MVLLDVKGRLFGKFNLFDLVILFLILLTLVTAAKLLFFNNSLRILVSAPADMPKCWPGETPNVESGAFVNIALTLLSNEQPEWFEKVIIPGETTWSGSKHQAKIIEKLTILQKKKNQVFYDMKIKFQLVALKKEGVLFYDGQEIKLNKIITIKMPNIDINGLVIMFSENENTTFVNATV